MLSLKPLISPITTCPNCGKENSGFDTYEFLGQHILSTGKCLKCQVFYYHNWPIGHGEQFSIAFTDNGKAKYADQAGQWLAQPLIRGVKEGRKHKVIIRRNINHSITHGVLINCLDPCFGHIIWKLFNVATRERFDEHQGWVVLIPAQCAWMVPTEVAEVWTVEVALHQLHDRLDGLDEFVRGTALESLTVAPLKTHLNHEHIPMERFFRTTPFALNSFMKKPFMVTFICREDRFWLRTKCEEFLWFVCRKYEIAGLQRWFLFRQNRSIQQIVRRVKKVIPQAQFALTGLSNHPTTMKGVTDLRRSQMDQEWELKWCDQYAQSHLVIGVHGSNMLIPTALAAGFIELMPRFKIPFMTEDILLRHAPRFQLFLGRHLDLFSSPKLIAKHVVDIYSSFTYLHANTSP